MGRVPMRANEWRPVARAAGRFVFGSIGEGRVFEIREPGGEFGVSHVFGVRPDAGDSIAAETAFVRALFQNRLPVLRRNLG
jgi:hypothetical protein